MGAMVKRNLGAGEALRSDDLMRPTDHGFMARWSPGMRAVTINVDAASGSSGLIWPGDRVDLILTQMNTDPNLSVGRRVSAHTVLSNVRVVAIDSQLVSAPNRNAPASLDAQNRTVTLEVDEEQAQRVAVGMRLGRLSVSVRASSAVAGNARTEGKRRRRPSPKTFCLTSSKNRRQPLLLPSSWRPPHRQHQPIHPCGCSPAQVMRRNSNFDACVRW